MYLEQEAYSLLLWSFIAVAVISLVIVVVLYLNSRNKNAFWLIGQIAFLSVSFYYFYRCVTYLPNQGNSMYTEIQTLTMAKAGISWAISMIFMFIGMYKLIRKKNRSEFHEL